MALTLSVPALSARAPADVELRPATVERWLAELPLLNVAETSRKLLGALTAYNRMAMEDRLRLALIELYRGPLRQISLELKKQYLGLPLPLSEKHKATAEQNFRLHAEMAYGYKRIASNVEAGTGLRPNEASLAIHRAIRYLTETLAVCYETYSPLPPGAWQEIHALFRHAESLGSEEKPLSDSLNTTTPSTSIGHAYKQALLLDLSDPYHLPARLIERIYRYLDRWAGNAVIAPFAAASESACLFVIDQDSDRSGMAYTSDIAIERPEQHRLLNTVELARIVHAHWTAAQEGRAIDPEGLEEHFFANDAQELLQRLIHAWGLIPKRTFRRDTQSDGKMDVIVGLDAIHRRLHGREKVIEEPRVPEEPAPYAEPQDLEPATWEVQDESAGGFALAQRGEIRTRVGVGSLVGNRRSGASGAWAVGAIRWVKSAGPSEVQIGLERLAPNAEPAAIAFLIGGDWDETFQAALRLPEIPALKQKPSLITHRGVYKPGRELYLKTAAGLYKIKITRALEITASFERLDYKLVKP